jgi:hypothetical protein
LRDRNRERQQREITTYLALNRAYNEFLSRCLNDPELATVKPVEAEGSDRKQNIHITMVVSMLESASFMYRDQGTKFRRAQWSGWNDYIREWCQHPEFKRRWPEVIEQFDSEFKNHVETLFDETQRKQSI